MKADVWLDAFGGQTGGLASAWSDRTLIFWPADEVVLGGAIVRAILT